MQKVAVRAVFSSTQRRSAAVITSRASFADSHLGEILDGAAPRWRDRLSSPSNQNGCAIKQGY